MDYIREVRPYDNLIGYGVCLGAGNLTNVSIQIIRTVSQYIASYSDSCPLTQAVCVGGYFDLSVTMKHIANSMGGLYDKVFWRFTKKISIEPIAIIDKMNETLAPHKVIGDELYKIKTLNEYCEKIIVKMAGFRDAQHYYHESTMLYRLKDVKIPIFFLQADDDPVVGADSIPYEISNENENIMIGVTKAGGHLGYFEGLLIPHK